MKLTIAVLLVVLGVALAAPKDGRREMFSKMMEKARRGNRYNAKSLAGLLGAVGTPGQNVLYDAYHEAQAVGAEAASGEADSFGGLKRSALDDLVGIVGHGMNVEEEAHPIAQAVKAEEPAGDAASIGGLKRGLAKKQAGSQPNVIFVLIDDMGYNDIGWNNAALNTPRIDELVSEGRIFDEAYANPVCTPSRASLMSGRFPHHDGTQHGVLVYAAATCVKHDKDWLPETLKSVGYNTHAIGKWHLGYCDWACTPTYRGFDTWYGFYQGLQDHYAHTSGGVYTGYDWRDGEEVDKSVEGLYTTDIITQRAVDIINEADDSPFFMYVSHAGIHTPAQVPDRFLKREIGSADERHIIEGMITSVDESTGLIVDALKAAGKWDNTVLIFSSDNGGESPTGSNIPFRGAKGSVWEGGVRVPSFVASPLMTAGQGTNVKGITHIVDVHTTILALAGAPIEDVHGVDQIDFFLNGGDSARDELVYNIDTDFYPMVGNGYRKGNIKMIVGNPGLMDGWEADGNVDFAHIVDVKGLNKKRGGYAFDWPSMIGYSQKMANIIQVFDLEADPEERNDIFDTIDMNTLLDVAGSFFEHYSYVSELDPLFMIENPAGNPAIGDGSWTPGFCTFK